ncbi:hypothetical protein P691DRAFT_708518 [Macrolepiota fuliginosa MF-IS2]|uniref:FHA domain-containing protein n=1 Tax=Macrolepiota fuliginosa MF-IS2 TaxID=1400762 RepID=A0A9P5XAL2_9AGAR|nr:hypothetical protein P691DRAFT_708518 [Macrolepiota fuliginosa MF-IS2]
MDTTGFTQVGRYGTLSLMKKQEPNTVVTAFGIDTEELTFGRDISCSVRLYYPDVNLVHCKIVFEERKAFLIVLGSAGLLVDGCRVYPNGTPEGQPTTIPLSNNSEIEIHNKRFRFSYPPKEIRATLLATPARPNRKLRLSMIHSAQVFSPRPSKDPRENLRILKSPMKNAFRSPTKPSALFQSPVTSGLDDNDDEEEEEEIILVDGNHPRVVEEDKDLVILEDVDVPVPPLIQVQPPKTPQRRRSQSLHRAVLIRSAHRAVIEHERQQRQEEEEREEEMEVLDTIASDEINPQEDDHTGEPDEHEYPPSDGETDSDEDAAEEEGGQEQRKPLWRKSLERLWPFRSTSPPDAEAANEEEAEQEEQEENSEEEVGEDERNEAQDQPEALPSLAQATPIRRPLGSFMTPQVTQKPAPFDRGDSLEPSRGRLGGGPPVRYSMGGEARRVPLEPLWRVKDIVIPLKEDEDESNQPPSVVESRLPGTPRQSNIGQPQASPSRSRLEISAEERKAIQERRRSALREVDTHSYFSGGIPGMSPSKEKAFASPTKPGFNDDANNPFWPVSPTKRGSISPVKDIERRLSTDEEDEKLDTRSLLERMKETVEGMKRRRSTIGISAPSPAKPSSSSSNVFEGVAYTPLVHTSSEDQNDIEKENDASAMDIDEPFPLLRSPSKNPVPLEIQIDEEPTYESVVDNTPTVPVIVEEAIVDEQPHLQEEAAQPEPETSQLQVPLGRSRIRSRSPQPPAEAPKATTSRRTRKPTAELEETQEVPAIEVSKHAIPKATKPTGQEPPAPPPAGVAPTRRVRKPTVEPEDPQPTRRGRKTPTIVEAPAPTVKRSTRNVVVKEEKAAAVPAPARRGRPPKATTATATATATTSGQSDDNAKRSTMRGRGTRVVPTEADNGDGDDPLDAFNTSEEVPTEDPPPAPIPAKTAAKTRKPRTAMKQEEETTEVLKTTITKSRTAGTAAKTPAPTRGRPRKTPATAPAATQVKGDKENAPRARPADGPSGKTAAGDTDEGVVVKVKTTRKTRTATVKQEVEDAAQPKARATRATRARTTTT